MRTAAAPGLARAQQAPAGQGARAGDARRAALPVPGYTVIAAGILLGIGGVLFAFSRQDGSPDRD